MAFDIKKLAFAITFLPELAVGLLTLKTLLECVLMLLR